MIKKVENAAISAYPRRGAMPPCSVLIVDDFPPFREFVSSVLRDTAEFRVVGQAADGLEAVRKAEEHQPDVILLDVGLPSLNGIAAHRRMSVVAPRSKVIFLSRNSDQAVVSSALSNGAYGYVLKSDASRELLPALAAIVRGQKYLSTGLPSA